MCGTFFAEAVDEELLQILFGANRPNYCPHVAHADAKSTRQPKLHNRVFGQADGIGEKLPQKIDTRPALPHQHYEVNRVGISCLLHVDSSGRALMTDHCLRGRGLEWQELQPPVHHAIGLGEKPVTSNIDAIAFVLDRSAMPPMYSLRSRTIGLMLVRFSNS
jgi:hypothetical protein